MKNSMKPMMAMKKTDEPKVKPVGPKPKPVGPKPKPMKRVMLPEVKVVAPRIRKVVDETVRLYPKGMASKRSVDSLKRVGFSKAIGEPIIRRGEKAMYGPDASDIIKKALKKK